MPIFDVFPAVILSIKKKMYSHVDAEQLRAINLVNALVTSMDLTFHQVVHEKSFLSFLEKVITREREGESSMGSPALIARVKTLFTQWVIRFSADGDIFPNFALTHARLVEQGLLEPITTMSTTVAPVMDQYLINEAEGQEPEEFKAEVKETLKLFNAVFTAIAEKSDKKEDDLSRKEALISLAANLDRYSEQFGLWIEQLEPGEYMEEAMGLNDQVTEALQKYKRLRSGALDPDDGSDASSDSSD